MVLAAGLGLAGCGSGKSPIGPTMAARHPPPVRKPVVQGPKRPADMVAAVGDARPGAARVALRFDLRTRPQVAQPLDVDLVILPSAGLDRVYGKVEASDGLELVGGADIAPTDKPPAEDVPISRSIRVVPQREGVLTLRATVFADSGGVPSSQTFSIPLIAVAGEAAVGPPSPGTAGTAGTASSDAPARPAQTSAPATR